MPPHYGLCVARLPRPLIRRPISVTLVTVTALLVLVLSPVVAPLLLIADLVTQRAGPFGPYAVLAALVILASALSQALDGAPAVVLLAPVAFHIAQGMTIDPRTLMMGISLAASAAFMTPFSHKANLMVMGAGGYRSLDYVRVGTPLTLIVLALIVASVPLLLPF